MTDPQSLHAVADGHMHPDDDETPAAPALGPSASMLGRWYTITNPTAPAVSWTGRVTVLTTEPSALIEDATGRSVLLPLAYRFEPAPAPASEAQQARSSGYVQGRCPACGGEALFLGEGGYVTCARDTCPWPDATSALLDRPMLPRWDDNDPLLNDLAVAIWDSCQHQATTVVDDPRNIARAAAQVVQPLAEQLATAQAAARERADILEEARDQMEAAGHRRAHGDDWPDINPAIKDLIAERDRLAAALREMLAEFRFNTHPGRPCKQTGHISVATVERWHAALNGPTPAAICEPPPSDDDPIPC